MARQRGDSLCQLALRRPETTAAAAGFSHTTPTLTHINFISRLQVWGALKLPLSLPSSGIGCFVLPKWLLPLPLTPGVCCPAAGSEKAEEQTWRLPSAEYLQPRESLGPLLSHLHRPGNAVGARSGCQAATSTRPTERWSEDGFLWKFPRAKTDSRWQVPADPGVPFPGLAPVGAGGEHL